MHLRKRTFSSTIRDGAPVFITDLNGECDTDEANMLRRYESSPRLISGQWQLLDRRILCHQLTRAGAEGADHFLQEEAGEKVAEEIVAFVDRT